jgi:TrmH family RNA methyltransferase
MTTSGDRVYQRPLKWYQKLDTAKGRLEAGAFIIEGDRAIRQIMESHPDAIIEIVTSRKPLPLFGNCPIRLVTESQFHSLCSTKTPQGILAVIRIPPETYTAKLPSNPGDALVLLEDIQDPGNVGTLIRTSAAFGFSGVILTEKCADPFSPKCVQSTAGSVLSVWLRRTGSYLDLVNQLKNNRYILIATDLNGNEEPSILQQRKKMLLALGNEAAGLSQSLRKMADHYVKIPIARDKVESLNVAICGAILMYLNSQKP